MHVVVIGCGLAGVTTAWFLHHAGATVTVLDRNSGPARETSFANGSLLTPSLSDPWNAPGVWRELIRSIGRDDAPMLLHLDQVIPLGGWGLRFLLSSRARAFEASFLANVRLARYSQTVMAEIRADTGLAFEHANPGTLKIFEDPEALDKAVRVGHWLKQVEIEHMVLDVDALVAREPALAETAGRLVGAVHYPDDEVGNARLFCEGLVAHLAEAGVTFYFTRQALDFATAGQSIVSVATPSGPIAVDAVVLAAGSFSREIGRRLGLRLPVMPAKGYSITVPIGHGLLPRHPVVDDALHAAVVPLGGDRLRVAGTAEFAGNDASVRPERIANLVGLLRRVYPSIAVDEGRLAPWAGLRPMTPDGKPILGRTPIANLYLNTGHGPLGWTLAAGSGKLVADVITGSAPSHDLAPFGLDRF
jgi:D-amino-acid dehydrogenase